MARRSDALLQFDAIAIEGGLLPPEWLGRVAALDAPAQQPADYGVPKGLELRDEITRYWRMAEALWADWLVARSHARDDGAGVTRSFVADLLRQCFGFADLAPAGLREIDERAFDVTFEAVGGNVPLIVGVPGETLDTSVARHAAGGRRRSAWGALQDYLNASDGALWGIVSNGTRLRIGRDNTSLTRPAWIEADVERMFEEERFADFSVLWLLLHASRFGAAETDVNECPLEQWRDAAREAGTRARDQLRLGVEESLLRLGRGFLEHPANAELRRRLSVGELSPTDYFNELLRLVYRMIFLLTIEERGILHADDVSAETRALYDEGYGMRRLRDRAVRRSQYDRHTDLWASLLPVFAALGRPGGEPVLGLPGLAGLFAPSQCPNLDQATLRNRDLLAAVFHLAWLRETAGLARVNWKDMGPEELGSVYESLLELVPVVGNGGRSFDFAGDGETAGNVRKLTGSYYTPDALVQQLLDTALEPVVSARLAADPDDQERALLSISVIDPACGSGHFLLAAARRLATRLAHVRAGGTPGADEYRHALRDVVTHCIHGVDRNPMAIELARMSLWLETYTPDRALGFLDHHLIEGDALVGLLDLDVLREGIPDDAFKALTGDDRDVVNTLRKVNREARKALKKLQKSENLTLQLGTQPLAHAFAQLDELSDDAIENVEAKRDRYEALRAEAEKSPLALAADIYLAAFLMPKRLLSDERSLTERAAVSRFAQSGALLMALDGSLTPRHTVAVEAQEVCHQAKVLHWKLAFPQVFGRGGFDVVLGNPPWERIKLQEQEFFASRAPEIAHARNKAERQRMIDELAAAQAGSRERSLFDDFTDAKQQAEAVSVFCHSDARYPLTGVGDVNTYALFAETGYRLIASNGRAGLVLPTGIATDDSTKKFFSDVVESNRLVSLYDFENREGLFPAVDSRQKFCLFTIGRSEAAEFAFFLTQAHQLSDERRRFELTPEDFRLINPNTRTCPVFRSRMDAELTKKIYRNVPVLIDETKPEEEGNPWGLSFRTMFHMSNDSGLFLDAPEDDALPLYEAKMIHQFDHRWATYETDGAGSPSSRNVTDTEKADPGFKVTPRYWVRKREVQRASARAPKGMLDVLDHDNDDWHRQFVAQWVGGYHLNRGNTDAGERILRESRVVEQEAGSLMSWETPRALESEFPLDDAEVEALQAYGTGREGIEMLVEARTPRWFIGWRDICRATDERTVIASILPRAAVGHSMPLMFADVPPAAAALVLANTCSIVLDFVARQKVGGTHLTYAYLKQLPMLPLDHYDGAAREAVLERTVQLVYTADNLQHWARDLGVNSEPFSWDRERRAQLRAELDAYYAKLYGLSRQELEYILDPSTIMGSDYPSETFRVLKNNEIREFGEYRTQRLVLDAWDRRAAETPTRHASAPSA